MTTTTTAKKTSSVSHLKPPGRSLLSAPVLKRRVKSLAAEIEAHYEGRPLTVLGLLNGSIFFLVDLVRQLPADTQVECWRVQSYKARSSGGKLLGLDHCGGDFHGRQVLIVDDILDTGVTLTAVRKRVLELGASGVEICVLLRKNRRQEQPVKSRWVGFDIPDRFVVGYGLDEDGRFRALNSIRVLD